MNILIPIAGIPAEQGESQYIRGLYEIEKKIVLQHILESLAQLPDPHFIAVIRREEVRTLHLDDTLRLLVPDIRIVVSEGSTQGAACSCLLAVDYIDNEQPLLISGSDQIITHNWGKIIREFERNAYDAGVVYFEAVHPKWSYVRLDEGGLVVEAAEKHPISRNATTGQYYFRHGADFVQAAQEMIRKEANVNGQYYVCPAFNELVLHQKRIGAYPIDRNEYFSLKDQKGMDAYESYLQKEAQHVHG